MSNAVGRGFEPRSG